MTAIIAISLTAVLPVPPSLISLESSEGANLLASQSSKSRAWNMLSHFETQSTQSFCSVATAVVMLNSLRMPAPTDPVFAPYAYFTQADVLGSCAMALPSHVPGVNLSAGFIATHGATLDEWRSYLACWANVTRFYASSSTPAMFRTQARAALESETLSSVGINFHRSALDEIGGGHMSPLAAYDASSDRFLLLDVARYKYPPVWVRTEQLFAAMNTTSDSGESRGWVVVTPPSTNNTYGASINTIGGPRPNMKALSACISALRPSDSHGAIACFANPSEPPTWHAELAVDGTLCFVGSLSGAMLALCCFQRFPRYLKSGRRQWDVELKDFPGSGRAAAMQECHQPM